MRDRLPRGAALLLLVLAVLATTAWAGSFSDNFNRADNVDLGANWDPETGLDLQIVSNKVRGQTVGSGQEEITNQGSPGNDQYARVTLATFTSGGVYGDVRVMVRATDPGTARAYYICFAYKNEGSGFTSEIIYRNGGSITSLGTESATTWGAGDQLECRAVGTTISLHRVPSGGSSGQLLSFTDSNFASGRVGMGTRDDGALGNVEIDDFIGGDYPPPTGARQRCVGCGSDPKVIE